MSRKLSLWPENCYIIALCNFIECLDVRLSFIQIPTMCIPSSGSASSCLITSLPGLADGVGLARLPLERMLLAAILGMVVLRSA